MEQKEVEFLVAVRDLQPNAYGVTLHERLGGSLGAIYLMMDAAMAAGLVTTRLGDPTPERGNRPKRFVFLTREGLEALASAERTELDTGAAWGMA